MSDSISLPQNDVESQKEVKDVSAPLLNSNRKQEVADKVQYEEKKLHYGLEDIPPWYTSLLLGFQHYVTFVVGSVSIPVVLCPKLCMLDDDPARGQLVSSLIFVSGLGTILQTVFGVRLPIVQGNSFGFLAPALALLNLPKWQCPPPEEVALMSHEERQGLWQARINEVSGAIVIASLFQIVIGYFGLIGAILKYITPLTIAPTVALIGLSLFDAAAKEASGNWWVAVSTIALLTLFSLYLRDVQVPLPTISNDSDPQSNNNDEVKKPKKNTFPIFQIFPVLLAMVIMWIICAFLTYGDLLEDYNLARTDTKIRILHDAPWFHFPYPGQWGTPTVSAAAVCGMLAGVVAGAIESVGDYYACAQFCDTPPPPMHAVNRGIGTEGIGCLLAGLWGTGNGTTSFSQNIGAIGVTKVGSRRVVQYAGVIMIVLGVFSKVGAFFVTIPSPIIGGVFCITFGMVAAVGISTLQFVSLKSFRNMYIIGFSIFFALVLPRWMHENSDVIKTGSEFFDQLCTVLLSTSMFVGGMLGFILDNTVPGTIEERGLVEWCKQHEASVTLLGDKVTPTSCYDLPFGMDAINRWKLAKYIPFLPTFQHT